MNLLLFSSILLLLNLILDWVTDTTSKTKLKAYLDFHSSDIKAFFIVDWLLSETFIQVKTFIQVEMAYFFLYAVYVFKMMPFFIRRHLEVKNLAS